MHLPLGVTLPLVGIISFALTYIALPPLIRKLMRKNMVAPDMNKKGKPKAAKFGGIAVFLGFIVAFLLPLQLNTSSISAEILLGVALSTSLIAFLGFADDVLDIPDIYRVVLPLFAALPLMLIKVGTTTMQLPLLGEVDFYLGSIALPIVGTIGLNMYVLLLIPIGVVATSNLINLLAGFNGLEVGLGIIICIFLILFLITSGLDKNKVIAIFLLISLIGSLGAFIIFNWYPAKVFPGNIVTYLIGASIAAVVILANIERFGAILLMPQIVEFLLKSRSRFNAENFGTYVDGRLRYDGKVCSLTHLLMKLFNPTEKQLVVMLYGIQTLAGIAALLLLVAA